MYGRVRRRAADEEGAAAVEFALVWLLLATFVIALIQFGVTFNHWLQVTHGAREGARWASLRNPDTETRAHVLASTQLPIDPNNITITPSNPGQANQGQPVVVTVSYRSPVFGPLGDLILGGPGAGTILLSSTSQQMVE